MLNFELNKEKELSFELDIEGIDSNEIEPYFRIFNENINFGFKGKFENGNISFNIPPLNELFKNNLKESYPAKLEIIGAKKYYFLPWQDDIFIKKEPSISNISLKENKEEEKTKISITSIKENNKIKKKKIEEKRKEEKEENKKEEKKSKISKIF